MQMKRRMIPTDLAATAASRFAKGSAGKIDVTRVVPSRSHFFRHLSNLYFGGFGAMYDLGRTSGSLAANSQPKIYGDVVRRALIGRWVVPARLANSLRSLIPRGVGVRVGTGSEATYETIARAAGFVSQPVGGAPATRMATCEGSQGRYAARQPTCSNEATPASKFSGTGFSLNRRTTRC